MKIYVQIIYRLANYGVVLLFVVVSLMVGLTTGVPMSRHDRYACRHDRYQTATPASYHTTTYATTGVLHH
jgi:hypothetical protein